MHTKKKLSITAFVRSLLYSSTIHQYMAKRKMFPLSLFYDYNCLVFAGKSFNCWYVASITMGGFAHLMFLKQETSPAIPLTVFNGDFNF